MKTKLHLQMCKWHEDDGIFYYLINRTLFDARAVRFETRLPYAGQYEIDVHDQKYEEIFLVLNIKRNSLTNFFEQDYRYDFLLNLNNYGYLKWWWEEMIEEYED